MPQKPQIKDILTKPIKDYTDKELAGMTELADDEILQWKAFLRLVKSEQIRRFDNALFKK